MIPVIKQTHKKKRKEKFQNNSKAVRFENDPNYQSSEWQNFSNNKITVSHLS